METNSNNIAFIASSDIRKINNDKIEDAKFIRKYAGNIYYIMEPLTLLTYKSDDLDQGPVQLTEGDVILEYSFNDKNGFHHRFIKINNETLSADMKSYKEYKDFNEAKRKASQLAGVDMCNNACPDMCNDACPECA